MTSQAHIDRRRKQHAQGLVTRWLLGDLVYSERIPAPDTSKASQALASLFLDVKPRFPCHPQDVADLGRCLRLIALVPEVRRMVDDLALMDATWLRLSRAWDKLERKMVAEVGIDWSKGSKAVDTAQLLFWVLSDELDVNKG